MNYGGCASQTPTRKAFALWDTSFEVVQYEGMGFGGVGIIFPSSIDNDD